MKKVLITGANGYIGGYLQNVLRERYHIVSTDIQDANIKDYFSCDLLNRSGVSGLINNVLPDVIVHCAGTKDIFGCEKDPGMAYKINVETTKNLIDSIDGSRTKFIFLSSDYVFRGDRGGYSEKDIPDPKTVYGKTKLICEKYIQDIPYYTICRTANVYGEGNKFFSFILDSLRDNKVIDVYNDSYFSPTYIGDLSDMISIVIGQDISGILHTAGRERISRYDFALKIAEYFGLNTELIKSAFKPKDSPIADDSSLDVSMAMETFGIRFMGIDEGLVKVMSKVYGKISPQSTQS